MAETAENKIVAYADESVLLSADPPLYVVGADDPRLWLPDQILGAYSESARQLKAAEKWEDDWKSVMESIKALGVKLR